MTFSLVACGNKTEEQKPVETNPTVATPAEVVDVTAEKQAYYDNYFASEDFGFAGESFMAKAEGMEIAIMKAQDKTCLFKMAMGETLFEIYVDKDGQQFAHLKTPASEGQEALDAWYRYNNEGAPEEEKDAFASMSADANMGDFAIDNESIVKVEYLGTEDGFDMIKVSSKNPEYDENSNITYYDIKFMVDEQECTMTVAHEAFEDGASSMYLNQNVVETFDVMDYDFDIENKKWLPSEEGLEEIEFEVVSESKGDIAEFIDVEILVVEETNKVAKMTQLVDGIETVVEFGSPLSCEQEVEIPANVEECDAETLAMLYLAVLFSALA